MFISKGVWRRHELENVQLRGEVKRLRQENAQLRGEVTRLKANIGLALDPPRPRKRFLPKW